MKGFGPISYLIARGRPASPHDCDQPYITYTPPSAERDCVLIGICDGHGPHSAGGECSPEQVLSRPGLVRRVERLEAAWFLPFVRRLADGESVAIMEIAAAYHHHNNSQIESKRFGTDFFPCEQAAFAWAIANPALKSCLINLIGDAARLAQADLRAWRTSVAREIHGYIQAQYVHGAPAPAQHRAHILLRTWVDQCMQAARAADREGITTSEARIAALKNVPPIVGLANATYESLFAGLT